MNSETNLTAAIALCILLMVALFANKEFNIIGQFENIYDENPWAPYYDRWLKKINVPPSASIGDHEMSYFAKGGHSVTKALRNKFSEKYH